ncbi:MAG TPA: UvrB/UvrC motif-containing protein, partial [Allosphingosinicella sp.]
MSDEIGDLHRRMEEAAAAMDFEEAKRLRDRIALIRGGASVEEARSAD